MAVLVTGGAGYIGSHTVLSALERGEKVVVLDNLSTGQHWLVPAAAKFVHGDAGDGALVAQIIRDEAIDAVLHFAGSIIVPESVRDPLSYYLNNTVVSRTLIGTCVASGVRHFVFSSTAAVYGDPGAQAVKEDAPKDPVSPYGRSKLMTEWMLEDVSRATDLRFVALRYFNVAGADVMGRTGQVTRAPTHLIKRACQVALGVIPCLEIFGTDYPTPDGTAIRDFIHVDDLVAAHLLALDYLGRGGSSTVCNVGYAQGFSVNQVVRAVEAVASARLPIRLAPRRAGDPAQVVADNGRIMSQMGWVPRRNDLREIVRSAYAWERRLLNDQALAG
jgi:UDP-glucose 4-epimerase